MLRISICIHHSPRNKSSIQFQFYYMQFFASAFCIELTLLNCTIVHMYTTEGLSTTWAWTLRGPSCRSCRTCLGTRWVKSTGPGTLHSSYGRGGECGETESWSKGQVRGAFKIKLQSVNNMNIAIVRNELTKIVYLPLQEQIKHAIQNALSIFCKLQISRLCVYMRRPPPRILKGILRCLNFLYIKFLKTNVVC